MQHVKNGRISHMDHVQASQQPTHKRAKRPCSSEPSPVSYCYSMLLNSCVTSLHRVTRIVSVLSPFLLDAVFVCFYQCWILESHWLWKPHFREWEKLELQWDPKQTNDAFCLPLFLHQFMMHLTRKHLGVQYWAWNLCFQVTPAKPFPQIYLTKHVKWNSMTHTVSPRQLSLSHHVNSCSPFPFISHVCV